MSEAQHKIAERLIILNDRCVGLLTRLYNIKKSCGNINSRPKALTEKDFEQAISIVVKKFPVNDLRKHSSAFSNVDKSKADVLKNLHPYYFTFVHLLELKEHVLQQLALMDANQFTLDISLNFDATTAFFNMIINFISAMILLSRIEERKSLVGLYNAAHELEKGVSETKFPRLAQLIVDYDSPMKKLAEDFSPVHRLIRQALMSISPIYKRRNISAEEQRASAMISLASNPAELLYVAQTNTCACEYLSVDLMNRWIILCVTVCHNNLLADEHVTDLFYRALRDGVCIRLFRDENVLVFSMLQNLFETIKGYHKRCQEIKDLYNITLQTSVSFHAHRRQFLRSALRDLCFLFKDQPGLLGPKILFIWMGLSYARDEVNWLLRHNQVWPTVIANKKAKEQTDVGINDKALPELLFYMIDLQNLMLKHAGVIARYHSQYVQKCDAIAVAEMLPSLAGLSERESILIQTAVDELQNISSDTCDLRAVRLDCFYFTQFDTQLNQTLNLPIQSRYAVTFAHICNHFIHALHDFCPEEHDDIVERALSHCNAVLDRLAVRVAEVIGRMTNDELILAQKLSPQACANCVSHAYQANGARVNVADTMPGVESYRMNREEVTDADKNYIYLVDLCNSIGYSKEIQTCDHVFAPREYLHQHIESELISTLHRYFRQNNVEPPRKPSEMHMLLSSQISVMQTVENCLRFDLTQFLNGVYLQQTQPQDSHGKDTLASIYSRWYLEVLLRKASICQLVYSEHLRSFISASDVVPLQFAPEQYTDTRELRALVQIIGPYGIKLMAERLVWHVACQINELLKLVREHKTELHEARISFDKPEKMRELTAKLSFADSTKDRKQGKEHSTSGSPIESVLQRVTIIGEIIAFRNMLYDALKDVVEQRLPFLISSLNGLFHSADPLGKVQMSEMCAAAGIQTDVDVALMSAIQAQAQTNRPNDDEEYYQETCLLFVFIAIALPKLATTKLSLYKAGVKASPNNCHVIPLAVNSMASALFYYHSRSDIQERMREFLALASSSLLQIIGTPEAEHMEMHQSVFTLLESLVKDSPWLHFGLLESCFPFTMIRSSFFKCYSHAEEAK
uniref:Nck-associated protein 1 n=1 Tax=Panagrolaimus sp. ES5 TaxID=591445 RepID=A0AC34GYP1_9BILA